MFPSLLLSFFSASLHRPCYLSTSLPSSIFLFCAYTEGLVSHFIRARTSPHAAPQAARTRRHSRRRPLSTVYATRTPRARRCMTTHSHTAPSVLPDCDVASQISYHTHALDTPADVHHSPDSATSRIHSMPCTRRSRRLRHLPAHRHRPRHNPTPPLGKYGCRAHLRYISPIPCAALTRARCRPDRLPRAP